MQSASAQPEARKPTRPPKPPAVPGEARPDTKAVLASGRAPGARRILVVDDDNYVVETLKEFLELEGHYEVLCAETGHEALRLAENELPDLILLDLRMPGLDGFEVCRFLQGHSETLHIPIVIFSVGDTVVEVVKAFQLGAVNYIMKPFSPMALLKSLQETLDRYDV